MAAMGSSAGGPIVLLGYPTALDAILARAGAETLQSIATASKGDPKQVMEELARRNLIRPITTQGHIGDVLPDQIAAGEFFHHLLRIAFGCGRDGLERLCARPSDNCIKRSRVSE